MTITVVIPNYNGANLIRKNLPYVVNALSGRKGVSVIIVDDGSKREDVLELRKTIDVINMSTKVPVSLIEREKNGGFSSAVNTGVRSAKSDLVVLLNSDVGPQKNFLEPVLNRFDIHADLFGVGCMDISTEGDKKVFRGRGLGYWKRGMFNHKRGNIDRQDTFWISGGSSVVRREIYEKLGGMDELFNPFYWEDIDLSYRARKAGYKIAFEKESKVEHRHEEGAIKTHYKKNKITTIAYRNQFIFHWKNITDFNLLLSHFLWLPYHLLKALSRFDKEFLNGFCLALTLLPDIINHRKKQKNLFVLKDKDIIK